MNQGYLMRRAQVIEELGVTRHEFAQISPKPLKPVYLKKGGRAYYLRAQVDGLKRSLELRGGC
jgi:hypothetical protein